jgi:hypothetical protein
MPAQTIPKLSRGAREKKKAAGQRQAAKRRQKQEDAPWDEECNFCIEGCTDCVSACIVPFKVSAKQWLILPNVPVKYANMIHCTGETAYPCILAALHEQKKVADPFAFYDKSFTATLPFRVPPNPFLSTAADINRCMGYAKKNQKLRIVFEKVARRFIHSRLKVGNTEDLLTNEVPKHPVTLISWTSRTIHTFEASTLRRDMIERLLLSSYGFSNAQMPRNPYTNVPMTIGQCMSSIQQICRAGGKSHWAIEGLASVDYDLEKFKVQFRQPLLLDILTRQHRSPTSDETVTLVLEFIEDQHEDNKMSFYPDVYRWALRNVSCPRIQRWRELWYAYSHVSICDPHGEHEKETRKKARQLCTYPTELIRMKVAATGQPQPAVVAEPSPDVFHIVIGAFAWHEPQ